MQSNYTSYNSFKITWISKDKLPPGAILKKAHYWKRWSLQNTEKEPTAMQRHCLWLRMQLARSIEKCIVSRTKKKYHACLRRRDRKRACVCSITCMSVEEGDSETLSFTAFSTVEIQHVVTIEFAGLWIDLYKPQYVFYTELIVNVNSGWQALSSVYATAKKQAERKRYILRLVWHDFAVGLCWGWSCLLLNGWLVLIDILIIPVRLCFLTLSLNEPISPEITWFCALSGWILYCDVAVYYRVCQCSTTALKMASRPIRSMLIICHALIERPKPLPVSHMLLTGCGFFTTSLMWWYSSKAWSWLSATHMRFLKFKFLSIKC